MIENLEINKLIYNGKNAIDIVIIADGFTISEQDLFHSKVEDAIDGIFRLTPFTENKNKFNVYSIPTISNESGISTISHPRNVITEDIKDTYLGSFRNRDGLIRYTDFTRKQELMLYLKKFFYKKIYLIVISNASYYGGSGDFPEMSLMPTAHVMRDDQYKTFKNLVVHEFAHSFGGLADEFGGSCTGAEAPLHFNTTLFDRGNVTKDNVNDRKWDYLINPQYIAGANYCNSWYRSTPSSIMKGWFEGGTHNDEIFNKVCIDLLIKRINEEVLYNKKIKTYTEDVNLIGKSYPEDTNIRIHADNVTLKTCLNCSTFYIAKGSTLLITETGTLKTRDLKNEGTIINKGKIELIVE